MRTKIIIALFFAFLSSYQGYSQIIEKEVSGIFRILNITRLKGGKNQVYVICVEKNNEIYKVVSEKNKRQKGLKIKKNKEYFLSLTPSLFFDNMMYNHAIPEPIHGIPIRWNDGCEGFQIYFTNFLRGIYYLPPEVGM
jgi:hypothetical protein